MNENSSSKFILLLQSLTESDCLELSEDRLRVRGKVEPEKWPLEDSVPLNPVGTGTSQLHADVPEFVPSGLHADVPEFVPGKLYSVLSQPGKTRVDVT